MYHNKIIYNSSLLVFHIYCTICTQPYAHTVTLVHTVHACSHTYTHTHTHAYTHARTRAHAHTHTHTRTHTHTYTHTHAHAHAHTHTHLGFTQSLCYDPPHTAHRLISVCKSILLQATTTYALSVYTYLVVHIKYCTALYCTIGWRTLYHWVVKSSTTQHLSVRMKPGLM